MDLAIPVIRLAEVIIPKDRQRQEFNPVSLLELKASIRKHGLFNAIQLNADRVTLQSGETRLRVIQDLALEGHAIRYHGLSIPVGWIPYTLIDSVDEATRYEMELDENIRRADLTWQEKARAVEKLHLLRKKQAPGWTQLDTAQEVANREGTPLTAAGYDATRAQISVAAFLDDPEVAGAKDEKAARKIVDKKQEVARRQQLAIALQGKTTTHHELFKGTMQKSIAELEDGTFQCIVTDPPYGINAQAFGSQATTTHEYSDTEEEFKLLMALFAMESYRVCANEAHLYLFCDQRHFAWLQAAFSAAGWDVWPTALIWDKNNTGMLPRPEHGPRRTYETILYAIKGDKKVNAVYGDVLRVSPESDKQHGAQKPEQLYIELLQRSVQPGDKVADFFAGSGTIFPAAEKMSCYAFGCEPVEEYYNVALERLHKLGV